MRMINKKNNVMSVQTIYGLTTTTTTTVLWLSDFVWDYPGELVPEEAFTHSHLS